MSIDVTPSDEATQLAERVRAEYAGQPIAFTVDDGCCENTSLQLQQLFWLDPANERIGEIGGVPVYCPPNVFRLIDGSTIRVTVVSSDDKVDSFSLETGLGCRFSTRIAPAAAAG